MANLQLILNVCGASIAVAGVITLAYTVGNTAGEIIGGALIFLGTSLIAVSKMAGIRE